MTALPPGTRVRYTGSTYTTLHDTTGTVAHVPGAVLNGYDLAATFLVDNIPETVLLNLGEVEELT